MPQKTDPWRDSPLAGGSTAAAFAFATESPEHARPPPPSNGPSVKSVPNDTSPVPDTSYQSPTAAKPTSNNGAGGPPVAAGMVQNELDQLESEVIHYMNISLEEKEKAEALTGRLESVTQEKEDLERQVDDLDEQLSRDVLLDQEDNVSSSAPEAGDTISRVSEKIAKLRTSAQKLEKDFKALNMISDQRAEMIAELQEKLRSKKQQLAQKTQEEDCLRKELASTKEILKSEKKNHVKLLGIHKALELRCNGLRAWGEQNNKKLAESEQARETLSGLLNQKATELKSVRMEAAAQAQNLHQLLERKKQEAESLNATQTDLLKQKVTEIGNLQQAGAIQAQNLQQLLERKQQEVDNLQATQSHLMARCKQAEAASLQYSQTIPQLQAQLASRAEPRPVSPCQCQPAPQQQELLKRIEDLTKALGRNQQRRMRVVGIGVDLSGSAAGSLEDGIKRVYAHLIDTLKSSPCQTYVMTVVHGPGSAASVTSTFGDDWATHKRILEGRRADGVGRDVECLRKIKETAIEAGAVLDLQVVLIGDNDTNYAAHVGMQEVCADFSTSNPPVHIHSVVVSTGTTTISEKFGYGSGAEAWASWDYVRATGGNRILWCQNNDLPNLSDLVH